MFPSRSPARGLNVLARLPQAQRCAGVQRIALSKEPNNGPNKEDRITDRKELPLCHGLLCTNSARGHRLTAVLQRVKRRQFLNERELARINPLRRHLDAIIRRFDLLADPKYADSGGDADNQAISHR